MSVVIETTIGDITVDLFCDERPVACLNFIKLCKLKYYNFNLFHNVEQGFIAQTGDPTGAGDGGSSVWGVVEGKHKRFFEAENLPKIYHTAAGLLSLVSAGKNLVGSQFFFTLGANLNSLDGIHCVIGEVVEGHEVLRKLNEAIVDDKFRPYQDIRITHTVILDDPFPDPRGFQVPSRSPSPSAERLQNGRIGADEDIDDTDGKSMEEIQEMLAEREAKARATILEIVGDLPDAEVAPPENVLFVCKLNPVTTDDDLEIIFSRFGVVKNCEVIRDKKSGDSLQYAFVEFENQKSCEAAYFKMDNVLIDDRRIHVDFSQSVSKVKWRGKGRGVEGPGGRLDFNSLRSDDRSRNEREKRSRDKKTGQANSRKDSELEERRRARELRHKAQEKSRSRSRDRFRRRDDERSNRNKSISKPRDRTERKYETCARKSKSRPRSQDKKRQEGKRSRSRQREQDRNGREYRARQDESEISSKYKYTEGHDRLKTTRPRDSHDQKQKTDGRNSNTDFRREREYDSARNSSKQESTKNERRERDYRQSRTRSRSPNKVKTEANKSQRIDHNSSSRKKSRSRSRENKNRGMHRSNVKEDRKQEKQKSPDRNRDRQREQSEKQRMDKKLTNSTERHRRTERSTSPQKREQQSEKRGHSRTEIIKRKEKARIEKHKNQRKVETFSSSDTDTDSSSETSSSSTSSSDTSSSSTSSSNSSGSTDSSSSADDRKKIKKSGKTKNNNKGKVSRNRTQVNLIEHRKEHKK